MASTGQKSAKQRDLAQIHIGAAALGLIRPGDDSAYRQMLQTVARVDSAGKLDHAGRAAVIHHLQACGWQRASKRSQPGERNAKASPQARLIMHIWSRLGAAGHLTDPSIAALRAYVRAQSAPYHPNRVGYSAPEMLPHDVAVRVIEHIKGWASRLNVDWRRHD